MTAWWVYPVNLFNCAGRTGCPDGFVIEMKLDFVKKISIVVCQLSEQWEEVEYNIVHNNQVLVGIGSKIEVPKNIQDSYRELLKDIASRIENGIDDPQDPIWNVTKETLIVEMKQLVNSVEN